MNEYGRVPIKLYRDTEFLCDSFPLSCLLKNRNPFVSCGLQSQQTRFGSQAIAGYLGFI
jgi:hypothetical protein